MSGRININEDINLPCAGEYVSHDRGCVGVCMDEFPYEWTNVVCVKILIHGYTSVCKICQVRDYVIASIITQQYSRD